MASDMMLERELFEGFKELLREKMDSLKEQLGLVSICT